MDVTITSDEKVKCGNIDYDTVPSCELKVFFENIVSLNILK